MAKGDLRINHDNSFFYPPKPKKEHDSDCIVFPFPHQKTDPENYSQSKRVRLWILSKFDNPASTSNYFNEKRATPKLLDSTLVKVSTKYICADTLNIAVDVKYSKLGIGFPRLPLGNQIISINTLSETQLLTRSLN
jgi:hypothetical protein